MTDLLGSTTRITTTTSDPNVIHTLPTEPDATQDIKESFKFPYWAYILIFGGVILVVILIIVAAKRQSNKKNKQKKINEYRTKEDKRFASVAAELGEMYTATDHVKVEKESRYYKKKGAPKPIKRTG